MNDVSFESHGVRLAAWYLSGAGSSSGAGRPCVVMAHGFAATRDSGLLPFAEAFAEAGLDVVLFDYRGFGDSEGSPRRLVSHRRHREDYHAAIAFARGLPGVDPERIVLWGSSYSGGHVVAVAAQDGRVAAVIAQGPAMDGAAALLQVLRYAGPRQVLALTAAGLRDAAGALLGRPPHEIPAVGPPGSLAVMTSEDAEPGYMAIAGPSFVNAVPARVALEVALNRPIRYAPQLRCPLLVVVADRDSVAPPSAARATAWKAPGLGEVRNYPAGHFDIYQEPIRSRSIADQLHFLRRHLALASSPEGAASA